MALGFSALRSKLIAVEYGPQGIGLFGSITTLALVATTLLGFGITILGVTTISSHPEGSRDRQVAVVAVRRGALVLTLACGAIFTPVVIGAGTVSRFFAIQQDEIVAVAIATASAILGGSRLAVLNAAGRILALAAATALGPALGTLLTAALILADSPHIIAVAVASPPAITMALALLADRVPGKAVSNISWRVSATHFARAMRLGGYVTAAACVSSGAQFLARFVTSSTQGLEATGQFQAAWVIGATYLGFLFTTFAVDYLPKLSRTRDPLELNRTVNFQLHFALAIMVPAIVILAALREPLMHSLYTGDFGVAASILRLQLLGDLFKLLGWSVAYVLLARADGPRYLLLEAVWGITYLIGISVSGILGEPRLTGAAYTLAYVAYASMALVLARKVGVQLTRASWLFVSGAAVYVSVALLAPIAAIVAVQAIGSVAVLLLALKRWHRNGLLRTRASAEFGASA
ncbi:hypothetical protein AB0N29_20160 [Nocardioides sp. NPDC092400]|uniref:hypothetical protein n=1 Tax=Nocardioides sp. NPDC092400 TaxID=3155196 RepID=UPI003438D53A